MQLNYVVTCFDILLFMGLKYWLVKNNEGCGDIQTTVSISVHSTTAIF